MSTQHEQYIIVFSTGVNSDLFNFTQLHVLTQATRMFLGLRYAPSGNFNNYTPLRLPPEDI